LARLLALLRDRNFLLRLISALILIPLALGAVTLGSWWFMALIAIFAGVAGHEWRKIVSPESPRYTEAVLICLLVGSLLVTGPGPAPDIELAGFLLILCAAIVFALSLVARLRESIMLTMGIPYILLPSFSLIWMRDLPDGLRLIVYLFCVVWATDIGAYLVGRIMGGPKLAPQISPKKTWSGAIGGTLIAGIVGLGVALLHKTDLPIVAFSLACFLAIVSQFGDLLESGIKRHFAVKDSGDIIPGHGGILDRVDGLLTASTGLAVFHGLLLALGYSWW